MNFNIEHPQTDKTIDEAEARLEAFGINYVPSGDWIPVSELLSGASEFAGMVVQSREMQRLTEYLSRIAPYKTTVLIQGESGTGKELVAQALHRLGPTPQGPFVTFNCSNLIALLAETQLFGHVRGAFTDARTDSLGYFRSADKGTLFLDEVGELALELQPKLLRVLETHEVQPVGSATTYRPDVRIIAATNRDLRSMVQRGAFREDLYHRLSAISVLVPPLRQRSQGVSALIASFVALSNNEFDKQVTFISRSAMNVLASRPWPGNVRELANVIRAAVMLTSCDRLDIADFPSLIQEFDSSRSRSADQKIESLGQAERRWMPTKTTDGNDRLSSGEINPGEGEYSLREAACSERKRALIRALDAAGGNCNRAAGLLGVSRFTVYRLIAQYGLKKKYTKRDSANED